MLYTANMQYRSREHVPVPSILTKEDLRVKGAQETCASLRAGFHLTQPKLVRNELLAYRNPEAGFPSLFCQLCHDKPTQNVNFARNRLEPPKAHAKLMHFAELKGKQLT